MPISFLREFGYLLAQKSIGRDFRAQVREIRDSTGDREALADAGRKHLERLLSHANVQVPYYRELFQRCGLVEGGDVDVSRFSRLPVLTKQVVRENYGRLTSTDSRTRRVYEDHTGGSTGEPLQILRDNICDSWVIATVRYYFKEFLGLDYLKSRKLLLGTPFREPPNGFAGWATLLLTNAVYYRTGWLSDAILDRYARVLNSYEADVVICYPSALYEIVKFIERRSLRVPKPKAIICSSEVLQDFIREEAEGVFGTKVYDFYGGNEANAIAGECKHGSMHVFTFNNHVETVGVDGLDGAGKVVVTPLHNFTMPLLRYENDDVAFPGGECGCGSPLPTMGKIVGRTMEYFVKEDGGLVHAFRIMPLFSTNRSIRAFQVIQEDYGRVRVLVVAEKGERAWQERAEEGIRDLMGPDCRVVWEYVDEIPRTPLGKHLYVKSLVHRD